MDLIMNFKDKLTAKEIGYLLSLVESDYEEVAQYVDSKELEKKIGSNTFITVNNTRWLITYEKVRFVRIYESNRGGGVAPELTQ